MKPIVNQILAGLRHTIRTYIVTIDMSDEQKKQLAEGLKQIALDVVESGAKGFAEGLSEEE